MRVCVIGAGLAGLAAADELARAGDDVVVCEARARVGGRVASRTLDNGSVIELGAEFVLPGYREMRRLAARFGLEFADKGMAYGNREPRGVELTPETLAGALETLRSGLAGLPTEATIDADRFLRELELDPVAREAILARAEISCAAPGELIAASALDHVAAIDEEPCPGVAGGNDRLPAALAAALPVAPLLDEPVRAVERSADGFRVSTETTAIDADAVVVAVPAPVVETIVFTPALPAAIVEELAAVVSGHAAKLFIPLSERPPTSAVMSVPDRYWTWTATGEDGSVQPVVSAFAGSAPALDRLQVEEGPERWLAAVARLRPDLALLLEDALLQTWSDDPWTRCAYSASTSRAGTAAVEEGGPGLAFCGEHLGHGEAGLMEGAIRSGLVAAAQLLAQRAVTPAS